ncbi:MAG: O-antigen ligase family protein [bacterium]|nr:O-antigen ligase family protein [bacterium]
MATPDKLLSLSILCILGLGIFNLRAAFLLVIFLRPLIDLTVNRVLFSVNDITVNVLSVFGLTLILLAFLLPLQHGFSFKALRKEPIFYSWILFIAIGFISLFSSFYPSETIKELLRFLSIFAAFVFGVFLFASPKQMEVLIKVLIWSALPTAILSLNQIINSTGLPEGTIYRVFGSMTHPNMLAFYLLLPIFLCVFLLLSLKRTRLDVYLYSFLGLFYITILFFTYTRGAYLALLVTFLIVGVVKFKKFLVVGAFVLLFAYIVTPSLQERFNSIFQANPYGSLSWRISLWRDGYNYFLDRPWQGYGLGTAERIVAANRDFRLGSPDPHNDYLRIALDGGLPLLAAHLLTAFLLIWFAALAFFREHRPKLKNFFLFFAAFSLSVYLAAFGDNIINDTALQWHWWTLAGAALAVVRRRADFV